MKSTLIVTGIIILAAVLRFYQLGSNPPSLDWDEASLAYNAYSFLTTGHDEYGNTFPTLSIRSFNDYKPPMYVYALMPSLFLFGKTDFAVRFPSALAGTLDAAAGELRFCSMGSPPFLQLSAGGELRIHAFPGSLLGVDAALEYEQEAIGVEPGDRLLFFTDGAFEAQGLGAVPYGVERLADRFRDIAGHPALADFCTSLQQDILDQTGLLRLPDDFTVILATLG